MSLLDRLRPPLVARKDLTTAAVLGAVDLHEGGAWSYLRDCGFPAKVVESAFTRDVRRGFLDYGVAPYRPWLTAQGHRYLSSWRNHPSTTTASR